MLTHALREDSPLKAWARALALTGPIGREPGRTLPNQIGQLAVLFGDKIALIGEEEALSYHELASRANRYAWWARGQGLSRGDVVCLMMHNCPDYLAAWLGLTRVGAVVALINTNLVGESLAHAIRIAAPRAIIVGGELAPAVEKVRSELDAALPCWVNDGDGEAEHCLRAVLDEQSPDPLTEDECASPTIRERALYVYTSGTTGLPKAAVVTHQRVLQWSYWFAGLLDIGENDRMYNCLPMYHSIGGVVAIGSVLVRGGSVVLRRKFSARTFWEEIVRTGSTLFQYIGELCRFLVNAPPSPSEREHHLRIACGNGLRADVWETFKSRFAIPKIVEFYAATESNFSLYNCEGKPGAIGRVPPFLAHRFPLALVAFDIEAGEPLRDERGLCRACGVDEIGEALGRIATDESDLTGRFEGYTDRAASDRKILRNVFTEGDAWFRSGDLMRRDAAGFFYFVDRVGETFRWKGENVSTAEVGEAVCAWPEVCEAVVYGVEVPQCDGRAGMVAMVTQRGEIDLPAFRLHLARTLPEFARPVFVRVCGALETTGTFKPKKADLMRVGFDPRLTTDPLFVDDRTSGAYVTLDASILDCIYAGRMRL